jgi:hypothetical protein
VGNGKHHLIPTFQPLGDGAYQSARKKNSTPVGKVAPLARPLPGKLASKAGNTALGKASTAPQKGRMLTQHTGLPPRVTGDARSSRKRSGS